MRTLLFETLTLLRRDSRRLTPPRLIEARLPRTAAFAQPTTYRCTACARATTKALGDCVLMLHLNHTRCPCGAYIRMPFAVRDALLDLARKPAAS